MPSAVKWSSPTHVSAPISGVTVNSAAGALGSEYDNETNKNRFASLELTFTHGSAPTENRVWLIYLLYAIDGTNYEDGDAVTQPKKQFVASVPVRANTAAQKVSVAVPLLPFKVKLLVWNDTDQNSSANSVTLNMEVFNEESQ